MRCSCSGQTSGALGRLRACEACALQFAANGGCALVMRGEDPTALVPEGCIGDDDGGCIPAMLARCGAAGPPDLVWVRLTPPEYSGLGALVLTPDDRVRPWGSWHARFSFSASGGVCGGTHQSEHCSSDEGLSFSFGDLPFVAFGEEGAGSGLRVSFLTGGGSPRVLVAWESAQLADVERGLRAKLLAREARAEVDQRDARRNVDVGVGRRGCRLTRRQIRTMKHHVLRLDVRMNEPTVGERLERHEQLRRDSPHEWGREGPPLTLLLELVEIRPVEGHRDASAPEHAHRAKQQRKELNYTQSSRGTVYSIIL